jgi:hypothetical protein
MTTKEQTLENYLEELGVKMTATQIEAPQSAPQWAKALGHFAWRVNLNYKGKRAAVTFYQGKAHSKAPSVADIVADLARNYDLSIYTLKEFGDEFGWDSETATTYRAVKRVGERFRNLFSDDAERLNIAELANEY